MSRTVKISSLGLLVFVGLLTGCSGEEAAPKTESAREAAPAAETADQAVMRVAEGLKDGRLEVVWQALPASYQRDVTDLIHDFAGAMDAELWDQGFGVIRKATQVLSEKREMILDHPMLQAQIEDREKANEAWESLIGVLDVVVHSDLSDLERMKSLDVEKFLSGTGAEVAGRLKGMEAFAATEAVSGSLFGPAGAEVTLVSSDGDRARVRFQAPDEPSTEEEFVRVEGKWVPTQMADEWNDTLAAAREQLAGLSGEAMQANKQMTLMQLSMVDGALDQLLATKTPEEFNAAIGGLLGMAMGAMMSQAQAAPSFEISPQAAQPQPQPAPQPQPRAARQVPPPKQGSLESYLGQTVRVTERDGSSTDGFLIEVTDSMLVVEKRFGESSMAIEVSRAEIDTVEPIRQ